MERYTALDILRGVALLGVLLVNILSDFRIPLAQHLRVLLATPTANLPQNQSKKIKNNAKQTKPLPHSACLNMHIRLLHRCYTHRKGGARRCLSTPAHPDVAEVTTPHSYNLTQRDIGLEALYCQDFDDDSTYPFFCPPVSQNLHHFPLAESGLSAGWELIDLRTLRTS